MPGKQINKTNLKSVAGGKDDSSASKVEKAKAIVKEELKRESLAKATGTGPIVVQVSGGATGEARPIAQTAKLLGQQASNSAPPYCPGDPSIG